MALTTSFRVSWTSVLVRVLGMPPEEIGVLHHPLLVDQQPALVDADVLELQGGECFVDAFLGVAVFDDRVGGQLRGGRHLEIDLDRVGLGGRVAPCRRR